MKTKILGVYDDATERFGPVTINGKRLDPRRSQYLRNHSPDGFAWGYGGSGPSQLALAILLEVTDSPDVALRHYQDFKWEFIAPIETSSVPLDIEVDIEEWIRERQGPKPESAL